MAQDMKKESHLKTFKKYNTVNWEKSGNSSWVQCNECSSWFHIVPSILERPDISMHCPNCHNEFTQENAKNMVIC